MHYIHIYKALTKCIINWITDMHWITINEYMYAYTIAYILLYTYLHANIYSQVSHFLSAQVNFYT